MLNTGVVKEVGGEVEGLKPGDRVWFVVPHCLQVTNSGDHERWRGANGDGWWQCAEECQIMTKKRLISHMYRDL